MRIGTSLRFLYPTGPHTYPIFKSMLDDMPAGRFIERPMGSFDTGEQARHVLETAALAREAGLSGLLFGGNHAVPALYANSFSPVPTVARMMAVTGDMPVGMVVLAPFYDPIVLAEQPGTLAAFASAPLVVVLVNGGNPRAFDAFGYDVSSRSRRLEELATVLRPLLAGEAMTHDGDFVQLDDVRISPLPRVPVEIWIGGTVAAAADRAGRLDDGWLTGQNSTDVETVEQATAYRAAAARHGRTARVVLRRDILVADTGREAHDEVDRVLAEGYRGGDKNNLLVGSPAEVIEQLAHYRSLGFEEIMVGHVTGDHARILRSIELLGEEVIPAIAEL